jgi:hypothetical protein
LPAVDTTDIVLAVDARLEGRAVPLSGVREGIEGRGYPIAGIADAS